MKVETQKDLVLRHLQEHGSITSMEAFVLFGTTRLSAVIYNLRHKDHYRVTSEPEIVKTRQGHKTTIARYVLDRGNQDEN